MNVSHNLKQLVVSRQIWQNGCSAAETGETQKSFRWGDWPRVHRRIVEDCLCQLQGLWMGPTRLEAQPVEGLQRLQQDLLLQQRVPGGALAQSAQEAVQALLRSRAGQGSSQQGNLQPVCWTGGEWTWCLQRGKPHPHLLVQFQQPKGKGAPGFPSKVPTTVDRNPK